MQIFYFDILENNALVEDQRGLYLPTDEDARDCVLSSISEILFERGAEDISIFVRDGTGSEVFKARMTLETSVPADSVT